MKGGILKMGKYDSHFLMTTEDVKDYLVDEIGYFNNKENLVVSEVGDGNINYVFIAKNIKTSDSVVIKQADKLLRASGRPLDLHRNKIEATILAIEDDLASGFVPKVYHYNEKMYALTMEDISAYKNMRTELMKCKIFEKFADDISSFMADTLIPTTDLILDSRKKKEYVKLFINYDLCDISEDLVFTKPYGDYKGRNHNIISEGNEEFVKENLYNNHELKTEIGFLKNNFMNNTQALIHGDLHSGSIFINKDGLKVIDPEFAFYGPIGYDIGNVIGNLYFSLAHAYFIGGENSEFIKWVEKMIVDVYELSRKKMIAKMDELIEDIVYTNEFRKQYIESIMSDALGYAGTEIIRRTIGDSKVAELNSLELSDKKLRMERDLVNIGILLIMNRKNLTSDKLISEFNKIIQ